MFASERQTRIVEMIRQYGRVHVDMLAQELGVSKQCVSNWENDNVQPSIEMLIKLAKRFNVSTDSLLDLTAENTVSLDGLSDKQAAHIRMLIADLSDK